MCTENLHRAEAQAGQVDPPFVHLARRLVENLAEDKEQSQADNISQSRTDKRQALQDEVAEVEVACFGQVCCKEGCGTGGVLDDVTHHGRGCGTDGGDEEDLDDVEAEVVVLGLQLDRAPRRAAAHLGHPSQEHGKDGHEDGEQDDGEKTSDHTEHNRGDAVDELECRDDLDEVVDVGDGADECDGNGPEDDKEDDDGRGGEATDNTRVPLDAEIVPENLRSSNISEWL